MNWQSLSSIDEINQLLKKSFDQPVLIFKHSTRCSISSTVLNRFETKWKANQDFKFEGYLLDLLNYRMVSNELASTFEVQHESPQVLVLVNGKCVNHKNHYEIDLEEILTEIKSI